jgi:hypothetical protein
MFIKISERREELIKKTGKLLLQPNPFANIKIDSDKQEHVIIYRNKELDCFPTSLFRCAVTYASDCLDIEDLTLRTKGVEPLKEDLLYLFLGWVIEDIPKWAKIVKKDHVYIQTKLPHCTEWFLKHNYDIGPASSKGYSGLKTLKT